MKKWIAWILIGLMLFAAGCSSVKNTLDWDAIVEEAETETSEDEDAIAEEPEEDLADPFAVETVAASPDEPVAAVDYAGCWGYINLSGQWVIAPQYDTAYPFVDNVATVQLQTGEWQFIDKSGAVLAQFPGDIQVYEPMLPHIYPGTIFDSGYDKSFCCRNTNSSKEKKEGMSERWLRKKSIPSAFVPTQNTEKRDKAVGGAGICA